MRTETCQPNGNRPFEAAAGWSAVVSFAATRNGLARHSAARHIKQTKSKTTTQSPPLPYVFYFATTSPKNNKIKRVRERGGEQQKPSRPARTVAKLVCRPRASLPHCGISILSKSWLVIARSSFSSSAHFRICRSLVQKTPQTSPQWFQSQR